MSQIAPLPVVALLACVLTACAAPTRPTPATAPSLDELRNATYQGIVEADGPVTLRDGRWEGTPYTAGGSSRPSVNLAPNFRRAGALGGPGDKAAVVLLAANAGGSGEMLYLAVVEQRGAQLVNVATAVIGDRVQVRSARIEEHRIVLDVVQAGADDARCCPGDLLSRHWTLQGDRLVEGTPVADGRLSIETLNGTTWTLRFWSPGEAVPATPEVTLRFEGNRIGGSAGCNRYFASVQDGASPGDFTVGPVGATRMMCPPEQMAVEDRFTQALASARKLGFMATHLALTYEHDGQVTAMLFGRE